MTAVGLSLGDVGNLLVKKDPAFDTRNFGFKKLSSLIEAYPSYFDLRKVNNNHLIVRKKKRKTSNPQPIGFRGNLLVKRQKFFYCTYSLGITETS